MADEKKVESATPTTTVLQMFPMFDKRIFKENTPGEGGGGTPPPTDDKNKGGTETPPPADDKSKGGETPPPPTDAEKRIKELNEESKKHRLRNKELEEENARYKKAMSIINGKDETPDPAKIEKEKVDSRVRSAYLKAAFVGVAAKEMHDADFAFDALAKHLGDVNVDLETGTVDKEALKAKVAEFKKAQPFLFISDEFNKGGAGGGNTPPPNNKDGSGTPNGSDPYKTWLQMKSQPGREREAQEFYEKNRAAIFAHMK